MSKPRDRAFKGTDEMTVLLERVPRRLIEQAKAKCRQQDPPVSLKWQILELLKGWVGKSSVVL